MNNVFWIGVYPGIHQEMLAYVLETFHSMMSQGIASVPHLAR